MSFRLADIFTDADVLKEASEEAESLLGEDPGLEREENAALNRMLQEYLADRFSELNL